jgi:hypothetical protein
MYVFWLFTYQVVQVTNFIPYASFMDLRSQSRVYFNISPCVHLFPMVHVASTSRMVVAIQLRYSLVRTIHVHFQ